MRKKKPDFETGWAELMEHIPAKHQPVIAERIANYREHCTVLQKLYTRASIKQLWTDLENYAGSEIDADYP
jgi:hypothetical protein